MGVGIDHDESGGGSTCRELLEIERFVDALEGLFAYRPGLTLIELSQLSGFPEVSQDRLGALRPFGMTFVHPVLIVGWMGEEGDHDRSCPLLR